MLLGYQNVQVERNLKMSKQVELINEQIICPANYMLFGLKVFEVKLGPSVISLHNNEQVICLVCMIWAKMR